MPAMTIRCVLASLLIAQMVDDVVTQQTGATKFGPPPTPAQQSPQTPDQSLVLTSSTLAIFETRSACRSSNE